MNNIVTRILQNAPFLVLVLVLVQLWAGYAVLLMSISLPELVQTVHELVHRRSSHDLLW